MSDLPNPINRFEKFLNAIATGDPTGLPKPITREETYLDYIARNGGGGGDIPIATPERLGKSKPDDDTIGIEEDGTLFVKDGAGGDAKLSADMTTTQNVGGVSSGETYEQGTELETIIRDVLAPTLYPMFTAPSASLSVDGSKILETGATAEKTFTIDFNRGSINPAYGTSGYRAGEATGYTLNGGASQASNTFTETVSVDNASFVGSVAYAQGEQPKDSSGADYDSPLAAGSVNTSTITYEFVDAMWANTAAIGTIAKLSLVSKSARQRDLNFPAQTVANPEVFDIPASWTVTAVQVKNDLSGAWDNASTQFTVTDVTHDDAAGNSVAYKRYTFNMGFDTGARSVRVKWS